MFLNLHLKWFFVSFMNVIKTWFQCINFRSEIFCLLFWLPVKEIHTSILPLSFTLFTFQVLPIFTDVFLNFFSFYGYLILYWYKNIMIFTLWNLASRIMVTLLCRHGYCCFSVDSELLDNFLFLLCLYVLS